MKEEAKEKPMIWWKDKKLLAGVILVVLSFILGFYGKVLFIIKFYEPVYLITGLSVYAFSFVLLFVGIFFVGWETVKMIKQRIHHHIKRTAKGTYEYTKSLPKRLHKKGVDTFTKAKNYFKNAKPKPKND